jgi:exonuclease III
LKDAPGSIDYYAFDMPELEDEDLPGDPDDSHRRYIEAAVNGILIGGLYLPNGSPLLVSSSTTN